MLNDAGGRERLLKLGAKAVLLKGGHGSGPESVDLLVAPGAARRFAAPRFDTNNTHGRSRHFGASSRSQICAREAISRS